MKGLLHTFGSQQDFGTLSINCHRLHYEYHYLNLYFTNLRKAFDFFQFDYLGVRGLENDSLVPSFLSFFFPLFLLTL